MKITEIDFKDYILTNRLKLLKLFILSFFISSSLILLNNIRYQPQTITTNPLQSAYPLASIGTAGNLTTSKSENLSNPVKAAFVVLVRNEELNGWLNSMEQLEFRFNRRFNYPYVFLNDKNFTQEFREAVTDRTNARVKFGLIPKEHWGYPDFIDKYRAAKNRVDSKDLDYGSSESYRHMCR
jgi:hypothetical protein